MKVLLIHKFHTKKRGGGSVTSYFETAAYLRERGHEVMFFSMSDPTNEPTSYEKYFAKGFDINQKRSLLQKVMLLPKVIYNREAVRALERLLNAERPDIAHVHNIYHYLTLGVLRVLKKHKIPIVMTLHDYHPVCPNFSLFVKGNICQRCKGGKFYHCAMHKCIKNSRTMSIVGMCEAYINKWCGFYDEVDQFIAPSTFMKEKCVAFGLSAQKIVVMRNNIVIPQSRTQMPESEEKYFLYYGRFTEEKGIDQLLTAVQNLVQGGALHGARLYIMGRGPLEDHLKDRVEREKLGKHVHFVPFVTGSDLDQIVGGSMFVVIPSVWYENAPFVAVEAQSYGKPLVVSDRGGTKELIDINKSGVVYHVEDTGALKDCIAQMIARTAQERAIMGEYGRAKVRSLMRDSENLVEIYQNIMVKK